MFVQFIRGRAADPAGLRRCMDDWERDLRAGAAGYLGSTSGITSDGEFVALARFESPEAAASNSGRPDQDAWWASMVACLAESPTVKDTDRVDMLFDNGCDRAQFVQVMEGSGDEAVLRDLDRRFLEIALPHRPDLLGGYRAYFADGSFVDVAYFTSEADARAAESKEMPPEVQGLFSELARVAPEMQYHDIAEPWLS